MFFQYFDRIPMVVKTFNGSDEDETPEQQLSRIQRQAQAAGIKGPPSRI
jgi:hypothetical protein